MPASPDARVPNRKLCGRFSPLNPQIQPIADWFLTSDYVEVFVFSLFF